jgi:parallel beta-helix repeat protein
MPRLSATVSAVALVCALASTSAGAVQRAFVASFGSDANTAANCSFANPCRGFTAALSVVDPGGEVVALDAAGYGAVTITKSVTITANPGFYAGISASTGNAVTISTAAVNVILRGLNINGIGATNGVLMTNGSSLSIENSVISNFGSSGIAIEAPVTVRIVDTMFRDNAGTGIYLDNGATASISGTKVFGNTYGIYVAVSSGTSTTTAGVADSNMSANYVGVYMCASSAGSTAHASVSRSTLLNNGYGIASNPCAGTHLLTASNNLVTGNSIEGFHNGSGTFESLGNNTLRQNGANTSGAITIVTGG